MAATLGCSQWNNKRIVKLDSFYFIRVHDVFERETASIQCQSLIFPQCIIWGGEVKTLTKKEMNKTCIFCMTSGNISFKSQTRLCLKPVPVYQNIWIYTTPWWFHEMSWIQHAFRTFRGILLVNSFTLKHLKSRLYDLWGGFCEWFEEVTTPDFYYLDNSS